MSGRLRKQLKPQLKLKMSLQPRAAAVINPVTAPKPPRVSLISIQQVNHLISHHYHGTLSGAQINLKKRTNCLDMLRGYISYITWFYSISKWCQLFLFVLHPSGVFR